MNLLLSIIIFYIFIVGFKTILHYIFSKSDLNINAIKYYMISSLLFTLLLIIINIIINITNK